VVLDVDDVDDVDVDDVDEVDEVLLLLLDVDDDDDVDDDVDDDDDVDEVDDDDVVDVVVTPQSKNAAEPFISNAGIVQFIGDIVTSIGTLGPTLYLYIVNTAPAFQVLYNEPFMYSFAVKQLNGYMLDITHVNLKLPESFVKKCNEAVSPEFHWVFVKAN